MVKNNQIQPKFVCYIAAKLPIFAIIPMKSYDDLQRFKEKTQTNHIEFRDMSDQTRSSDGANWATIRQLMDEDADATLGNGQSVQVSAPQPVAVDTFSQQSAPATVQVAQEVIRPSQSVAAFVAAKPAVQTSTSLLDSISGQLKPAAGVAQSAPIPDEPKDVPSSSSVALQTARQPQASAPLATDVASRSTDVHDADNTRFKQLFNATPESQASPLPKDTQLHALLERIASCR